MADVPRGARIVPIIAPHHGSHLEGSSVNDHRPENPPSEQSSQEGRPANSRNTRGKAETECLELASLTQLGLYALPTEGDGNDSPTSRNRPQSSPPLFFLGYIVFLTGYS